MKLRLVRQYKTLHIYCSNGTILNPSEKDLIKLISSFKKPNAFKGSNGYWNGNIFDMKDAPGETLAYIDDTNKLVILDEKIFSTIIKSDIKYISATEYANKVGKSRPSIKNMCAAGRIQGAYKTSSGWLIPENAPYPEDGRANNGGYHPSSKK